MGNILESPVERPVCCHKFIDLLCKLSVRNGHTPTCARRVDTFPFLSTALLAFVYMKPTVTEDEFEDAEEENKFINEVRVSSRV